MKELSREEQLLLADWNACIDTIHHEDGRKSHLFSIFLAMQGALFGIFGLVMNTNKSGSVWIVGVALILSIIWFFAMERMKAFIDLRYIQGEQLELKLGVIETIRIELALRRNGITKIHDSQMKLRYHQKIFSISNNLESFLPVFTAVIWIVIAFSSGTFI